jgi:hypothetical protein
MQTGVLIWLLLAHHVCHGDGETYLAVSVYRIFLLGLRSCLQPRYFKPLRMTFNPNRLKLQQTFMALPRGSHQTAVQS